jgi:FkbH-like protein
MVLGLDDIVAFEAGWKPKVDVMRELSASLRIGLDSFVFFDDDPAEREHVRQALPEVEVVEVPNDPAEYRQALLAGLWFESASISDEDRMRTTRYRVEQERIQAKSASDSLDDYLRSLGMIGEVAEIDEASIDRVVQLIGRTNQFNLTTRRHSSDAVAEMLEHPKTIGLTLRLRDRFGDHGLVSVIISASDSPGDTSSLRIDTWLMSCRVIGRTAEHFFFNALVGEAKRRNCSTLIGEHILSQKNAVVGDLYERLGFARREDASADGTLFELDLTDAPAAATHVNPVEPEK